MPCKSLQFIFLLIFCKALLPDVALGEVFNYPPLPGEQANSLDFAIDQQGHPVVAWGMMSKSELPVWRWNGSQWKMLGEKGLGGPVVNKEEGTVSYSVPYPSLTINSAGLPAVTWVNGGKIYYQSWDGEKWCELGGSASGGGMSRREDCLVESPALALDSQGNPFITWNEPVKLGNRQIYLRYWNGSSWAELGNSARESGLSIKADSLAAPVIAIDGRDRPFVAWDGNAIPPARGLGEQVFLKYWNHGRWEELDGSGGSRGVSKAGGDIGDVALSLDLNGNPIVAWLVSPTPGHSSSGASFLDNRIYLRQWNGTQWIELNGSATGEGICTAKDAWLHYLSIALDGKGRPVVACADRDSAKLFIRRWTGTQWVEPDLSGLKSLKSGAYSHLTIKSDKAGNLYLAWIDDSNQSASLIHVSKLDMPQ